MFFGEEDNISENRFHVGNHGLNLVLVCVKRDDIVRYVGSENI